MEVGRETGGRERRTEEREGGRAVVTEGGNFRGIEAGMEGGWHGRREVGWREADRGGIRGKEWEREKGEGIIE